MVSVGGLAKKIFGSSDERRVKLLRPRVEAVKDRFRRGIGGHAAADAQVVVSVFHRVTPM